MAALAAPPSVLLVVAAMLLLLLLLLRLDSVQQRGYLPDITQRAKKPYPHRRRELKIR